MFKITLSEASLLKDSIPIIAEIIDEGVLKVDKTGVGMISPDRTMVSVIDFKILSSAFEKYEVDKEEHVGLNMGNFAAVLKRAGTNDKITLELGKDGKLQVVLEGNGVRKFELPIIDVTTEKPPIDQLNFGGKVELDSNIVEEGIQDAEVIGDAVFFEAGPEQFRMYSKGSVSATELKFGKNDKGVLSLTAEKLIKAQYPLDYLKKMIKIGKLSPQMALEFGDDYPLKMTFKAIDKMQLTFILAPRVTEE